MAKNNQTKDQKKKERNRKRRERENSKNTFSYLNDVKKSSLIDEDNEYLPDSLLSLKKHMEGALAGGKDRYGVSDSPESDRFRHMMGMRNSALDPEVGPLMALIGGAGHEVNNLYGAFVDNDLSQLGTASSRLGAGQIFKNSSDDMLNNLAGILSAYFAPGEPNEEQLEYLLSFGVLPSDLRKPDSSTIMIDQDK
jgi:hypothetical protein